MSDASGRLRIFSEMLVSGLTRAVWGVRVSGLENVPLSGPLIVACNHSSLLDGPLLGSMIASRRRPCFLGKKELFANPLLSWFLLGTGVIPLDRGSGDLAALRAALGVLEDGGSLIVFPEGTRVKPGERRAPKPGVAFLAARAGARVLPARLKGTAEFPRAFPMTVAFGAPLEPPMPGREAAAEFARVVMDAIYSL
ncbi:MAG: 1-acyl-sn-glycerol-3-phosphate acyltransferase [Elusimicrobia bacterium]|nr:1-acyl-sn-glycerol-3-phosphate acyltransferase [Elusimicrobiota bacterium]